MATSSFQPLGTEVTCPQCEQPADVQVLDRDTELVVGSYVAAFGEYSVVHCS
ncbi:hypothetical protein [Haladaptatus halobius]|uniref:hypothetical protein n=1 Tax=Haladaptatus halobius TaxID=2884875 RepID=UPI001D0A80B1|nr:hypothetical protein [Haladaptatus halobius]